MKFKSKGVEQMGDGRLKVTGDLTINATTQEVVLDVPGRNDVEENAEGLSMIGSMPLSISEVVNRVGLRPSAIRYYEQIGILPPAQRVRDSDVMMSPYCIDWY
jgi:hypothetical protein